MLQNRGKVGLCNVIPCTDYTAVVISIVRLQDALITLHTSIVYEEYFVSKKSR